jgi:beta-glucosidase/6-phospho-beta-glucosidase/beta-galactosidase
MQWGVGIENTAIGVPIRHSGLTLDEFALTEHALRVRDDLGLAADLGSTIIRYGPPWYRVNPGPDRFRWDFVDQAIERATELGLTVVLDLVHYGVPAWIKGGFLDPAYPDAIAAYGAAFASRYRGAIAHFTPLNEPSVTATFCGETAGWPPYRSGPDGWTELTIALATGIQRTVAAIRNANSSARIVHVEQSKVVRPASPELSEAARLSELRAWAPTDLVLGRVNGSHPLAPWLLATGASASALDDLERRAVDLDVLGVNFYPQYSVRELMVSGSKVREVAGGGTGADLVMALRAFATRYGRSVAVTETSFDGDHEARTAWLRESVAAVRGAVSDGLDVWAYVWWPLFDFVDWGIAMNGYPLEDFLVRVARPDGSIDLVPPPPPSPETTNGDIGRWLRRMGLWRLEPGDTGLERLETPVASEYRSLIAAERPAEHPPRKPA